MNKLVKQAFTLIELLVVIAIIGILSGLIVVSMGGMTQKASIAKAQVFSNSLRNSLMMNIVGEWKFEGPTAVDATATSDDVKDTWGTNNGTVYGTPKIKGGTDCVSGKCLSFNGSADYIDCGNGDNLKNFSSTSAITYSGWVKINSFSGAGYALLNKWALNAGYIFSILADGKLRFYFDNNNRSTANSYITAGSWFHIAITWNGSGDDLVRFYVNGNLVETSTAITVLNITSQSTTIMGTLGGLSYFNGLLDDTRIYNSVVSSSQIKEQYYIGLNNLLINGSVSKKEYVSRINNFNDFISKK